MDNRHLAKKHLTNRQLTKRHFVYLQLKKNLWSGIWLKHCFEDMAVTLSLDLEESFELFRSNVGWPNVFLPKDAELSKLMKNELNVFPLSRMTRNFAFLQYLKK